MTMEQWTVKDLRQLKLHKETPFRVGQQPLDMGYTFFNLVRSVRGQGPVRLSSPPKPHCQRAHGEALTTPESPLPLFTKGGEQEGI